MQNKLMFKKIMSMLSIIMAIVLNMLLFSGCLTRLGDIEPPYGVWYSEETEMTLYIDPERYDKSYYFGTIVLDKEIVDIFFMLSAERELLMIYDYSALGEGVLHDYYPYCKFTGLFNVGRDGRMEYSLTGDYPELTGYKKIFFELIDTYGIPESSSEPM